MWELRTFVRFVDPRIMSRVRDLSVQLKLLGAFGLVLLFLGGGGGFATQRLASTTVAYGDLVNHTLADLNDAQTLETTFIARHKILKDVFLFNTNADKVKTTESDIASFDATA